MSSYNGAIYIKSTEEGDLYFNISAENGKIISTSKLYSNEADLMKGIDDIKKIFSSENLNIVDLRVDDGD